MDDYDPLISKEPWTQDVLECLSQTFNVVFHRGRANDTFSFRVAMQRGKPNLHWYWRFWIWFLGKDHLDKAIGPDQ